MKHIGIIGSRQRNSVFDLNCCLECFLDVYEEGDVIVSGGCPVGGDHFAEIIAEALGVKTMIYPADWSTHGRKAGFIRNRDIADRSDVLIAIITVDPDKSKGTRSTIKMVEQQDKPVILDRRNPNPDPPEEFDIENFC